MRVLHVVRQFAPSVGGLEDVVLNLAVQQHKSGIDAEVLTLDRRFTDPTTALPHREVIQGVPVRRVGFIGPQRYPVALSVLRHVRPFQLVHVHGLDFFADFLSATRAVHRKPLVLTTHGGFFHTDQFARIKRVWFRTITAQTLKRFSAIAASSENDIELFRPIADQRLRLVENGVDVRKFAASAAQDQVPSFVFIGRCAQHKGLGHLLSVFDALCHDVSDARLELIGNDWDGTMDKVRAQLATLQHARSVRIHSGLDNAGTKTVLERCSYFVSASTYEGFGLALVEAMAAGLVPIVNAIPSFKSIIGAADVGLVTDFSRDPAVVAGEIAHFLHSTRTDHQRLRAKCILASGRYAWERVERRYAEIYEAVLGVRERAILGVRISVMDRAAAVRTIDQAAREHRQLNIAFANANTLNIAAADPNYQSTLERFLTLNDGVGVDIASKVKFGCRFAQNLNGTDFIPYYLDATERSFRIYLIGSSDRVMHRAARIFSGRWPRHRIVGFHSGYFTGEDEIRTICCDIRSAAADLVLVGMGNPLQELWIRRYGPDTQAALLFGVGALFDFVSGEVKRAPAWVQRLRCEWIYRAAQEPRRLWHRYFLGNVLFLGRVVRDRYRVILP